MSALRELNLPHQLNLPSRCVTVSIGGATSRRGNYAQCAQLVEAADRALYSAKHAGRDQMIISGQPIGLRSIA